MACNNVDPPCFFLYSRRTGRMPAIFLCRLHHRRMYFVCKRIDDLYDGPVHTPPSFCDMHRQRWFVFRTHTDDPGAHSAATRLKILNLVTSSCNKAGAVLCVCFALCTLHAHREPANVHTILHSDHTSVCNTDIYFVSYMTIIRRILHR